MSELAKRLEVLAGVIDGATEGPWEMVWNKDKSNRPYPSSFESWGLIQTPCGSPVVAVWKNVGYDFNAIIAARNEGPDLLREAATALESQAAEIEKLRGEVTGIATWLKETVESSDPSALNVMFNKFSMLQLAERLEKDYAALASRGTLPALEWRGK